MAKPPLTLFARVVDPAGALAMLREAGVVQVTEAEGGWTRARLQLKRGFLRSTTVEVTHSPDYYAGPGWAQQLEGMRAYFARLDERPQVQALISGLRFSLGFPGGVLPGGTEAPIDRLLRRLAHELQGVFFSPGVLLDQDGRVLAGPPEARDPRALWPSYVAELSREEVEDAPPPDAPRVARRALVLAAMSARGLMELRPDGGDVAALRADLWSWVQAVGLVPELEPREATFLASPDVAPEQALVDAVWSCEGLVVLGWALGWWPLPRCDVLAEPANLWAATHVMRDDAAARQLVAEASLRAPDELVSMQLHLLMFNWRMVDFRVRPGPVDFAEMSKGCWVGTFPLDGYDIVEGDLALQGHPVSRAPEALQQQAISTAVERHRAINWLHGGEASYSHTDTST